MKIPVHIAQKIAQLSQGETLPSSVAKHSIIEELISERIIERTGRIQKKIQLINRKALFLYLQNNYGINDLEKYIEVSQKENVQRSELVEISSNSKLKNVRTFKGFLVNSYLPIQATLNGEETTLNFTEGTFQFIYDFENFIPENNITIVGIENAENFRWIAKQKHLFEDIKPLFVSRYPQNQSKDLVKWLQSIPNNYLHFGDFDFAGIGIYLNEFKTHLPKKASFFIPENIEILIADKGNKNRYDKQKINFNTETIEDEKLSQLIQIIHYYKKGLDQEIFIKIASRKI
ncbi:DUF7281 domain-containing protein [Elizabethkingia anophelis]|uniref:DUF7281 domain-containing protein n=1 Tax=Elizabethkingia anophelis TaxID=1117645 RepID=UPI000D036D94|nr:hypothetical protein [Elizabethkingia anophelis]MYY46422.1 hypothetical protein [Elizabethkingia anophelis]PRQ84158.1 hypothetical protein CMT86_18115 [Elizabethkingia anophelis]PRQ85058.1 hypothetical protein CMT87_02565 [Elizabethkingia anophelis]